MSPKDRDAVLSAIRSEYSPPWCATCGHFGGLAALERVGTNSRWPEERWVFVSGPGCAGELPKGLRGYRLEVPAGAALAAATGIHWTRPDLRVVTITGDQDGYFSGLSALVSLAPRKPNVTWIVLDNSMAAQAGGVRRDGPNAQFGIILCSGVSFLGRALASDLDGATALLDRAVQKAGLSVVVLASGCTAFHRLDATEDLRRRAKPLPSSHKSGDLAAALKIVTERDELWTGALYEVPSS